MDIRQLEFCLVVAELGSLSKAASRLSVAQSALSRRIQDLESELGAPLFHRTGRGVVATEIGRSLLPRIQALVESAQALSHQVRAAQDAPTGLVRLGILASMTPLMLTPLLREIHDSLPQVRVRVIEGLTDHLEDLLASGRLDLAILYGPRPSRSPIDEELLRADLHVIGPPEDPLLEGAVRLSDLALRPVILPPPPNRLRTIVDRVAAEQRVRLQIAFELDAIPTMKDLAALGSAYALLPLHAVADEVSRGLLRAARLTEPAITRTVLLAATRAHPPDRAMTAVTRLIRAVARRQARPPIFDGQGASCDEPT